MTREAVIAFARDWDPQPFHLSDEAAAANPLFGRLSASGWHAVLLTQRQMDQFIKATRLKGLTRVGIGEIRCIGLFSRQRG